MEDPTVVVVIHSLSYTGTTWINILLGCHEEAFALGPPERVVSMYEEGWEQACLIHRSKCPFWPEFHQKYDPSGNFYLQLAARSGRRFIVINNPVMANKAGKDLQHPDIVVKHIRVIRDGRAMCRSFRRNNPEKDFYEAVKWFEHSGGAFEFDEQDPEVLCVRYEDVVKDQFSAMERFGEFIGLTYPRNFYKFWEFEHHITTGNAAPMGMILWHEEGRKWGDSRRQFYQNEFERLQKEPHKPIFDEGWKTDLTRRELFLFDHFCGKINQRRGYDRSTFTASELQRYRAEIKAILPVWLERPIRPYHERIKAILPSRVKTWIRPCYERMLCWRDRFYRRHRGRWGAGRCTGNGGGTMKSKDELDVTASVIAKDLALLREVAASRAELGHSQATVEHYAKPETIHSYLTQFDCSVRSHQPDFEEGTGIDFGCWFGLSTVVLYRMGARRVFGLDVVPDHVNVANAFLNALRLPGVEFALIQDAPFGRMRLEAQTVDWVVANDVFSFARPSYFAEFIEDIARVLKPGGTFYLNDGNNPHHQETADRLLQTYHQLEIGDGSLEAPEGQFFKVRCDMVRTELPSLSEKQVRRIARETAYRWGEEILNYARGVAEGDPAHLEPSVFLPRLLRTPIFPIHGRALGAVTDPRELSGLFQQKGLQPELRMGFGPAAFRGNGEPDLANSGRFYLLGRKRDNNGSDSRVKGRRS